MTSLDFGSQSGEGRSFISALRHELRPSKQATDYIGGGVGIASRREEFRDPSEVVARRHQRGFCFRFRPHLGEAGSGQQAVTDTFAPHGFFVASAFAHIIFERLAGTAIADAAIRLAVGPSESTDIADAFARRKDRPVGKRAWHDRHLKRKAGRRSQWIGENLCSPVPGKLNGLTLDFRVEAGFLAECEGGSDLNTGSTEAQRCFKFSRLSVRTGQPERQSQRADSLQFGDIARTIDRFTMGTKLHRAARRCIMTSSALTFDDEAIHAAVGFTGQRNGERSRGNNRNELWTLERRYVSATKHMRIEGGHEFLAGK